MNTNNKSTRRLSLTFGYLGVVFLLLACSVVGSGTQSNDDGSIQFENGTIQVKNEDGDWVPVAGESTFELVGELEQTDPWTVAGTALETNESTQIEEGLQVGDLVRVQGTVLEDGTWLAYSIQLAEEQSDPLIVLIGVVDSIDPWSVDGIELNVTDETEIQGDITVGMIVRVEILLLPDGTWEVLSIAPLGESTETSGCVSIVATILSVEGNEIQFLGWPVTVILNTGTQTEGENQNDENANGEEGSEGENQNEENGDEGSGEVTISSGQTVLAVVCVSDDGTLIIVQIIVLTTDQEGEVDTSTGGGEKVLICHKPDKKGGHTLSVSSSAVPAHLGHGDKLGACP
jgi:hypothetical protein